MKSLFTMSRALAIPFQHFRQASPRQVYRVAFVLLLAAELGFPLGIQVPLGLSRLAAQAAPAQPEATSMEHRSVGTQVKKNDLGEVIVLGHSFTIDSKILEQTRRINLYLPPSYQTSERHYPALFLLDGGVQEDFVHVAGLASLAAPFRHIREFILVGIEGIDRYHDLTSPTTVEEEKQRFPQHGGSAKFRQFIKQELLPQVHRDLRLTEETVLIGESLAGLFVTETLLLEPTLFSGYIAISPSLWWNEMSLAQSAADHLAKATTRPAAKTLRVYLSIADEGGDMRAGLDRLINALETTAPKTTQWHFEPMEQESHGTIFHPAALTAIRKLFATVEQE